MSVRLQVLLDEREMAEIREIAASRRMTVSDWVRQALRLARRESPRLARERKLAALAVAAAHAFPNGDIEAMNAEIARCYAHEGAG